MMNHHCCRLGILPFAFALGITSGLGVMVLGWLAWKFELGTSIVHLSGSLYKGYAPSLEGGLWGGLWGFIDGFVMGLILAIIYNLCLLCCKKKNP